MTEWEERGDGWLQKTYGPGAVGLVTANNSNSWHWQAARGEERLSGNTFSEDMAKQDAEQAMALPIEEFNRQVAEKLTRDIEALAARVIALCPTATVLPGYQAGYEACRLRFLSVLQEGLA